MIGYGYTSLQDALFGIRRAAQGLTTQTNIEFDKTVEPCFLIFIFESIVSVTHVSGGKEIKFKWKLDFDTHGGYYGVNEQQIFL